MIDETNSAADSESSADNDSIITEESIIDNKWDAANSIKGEKKYGRQSFRSLREST